MAFTPRTYEQILNDMVAYMQSRTTISDYNVGSVIRTILEAAALEDDEQYFQMVQLLDLFSFTTAEGEDLDRRLSDFGLTRRAAVAATSRVKFYDSTLIKTTAALDVLAADTNLTGYDTTRFPVVGFPYVIRIGEGTARVQNLAVSANNTSTGVLTVAPLLYDVFIGDRIAFVTGGTLAVPVPPTASARTIVIGTELQAPPSVTEAARIYTTTEPGFIIRGNYQSNEVRVKCTTSGTAGNIGAGRISQFASSAPFSGAGILSISQASGGLNRQTDVEFRDAATKQLQALSRGTVQAIKTSAIGVTDPITLARVTSSNLVEDFTNNEVLVYVDDGTGNVATSTILVSDSLSVDANAGDMVLTLNDLSDWPASGWILISESGITAAELVQYVSNNGVTLSLASAVVEVIHPAGAVVTFVDIVSSSAEATQRRFSLTNYPTVRGTERIWTQTNVSQPWVLLTRDTDYKLNKGTGEFQLTDVGGVLAGTKVIAHYSYYVNLLAEVQKVLEGDPDDPLNYPGVKAAGVFLSVEQPVIKRITVTCSITASDGFVESVIAPSVQRAIESYISSRRIGQDVITSKIIDVAYSVRGLEDIHVITPTNNIIVLENELPIPFDAAGDTLVQVL